MNAKTLSALAIATAVALVAAIWIHSANAPVSEESAKDKPLLPGLRDQLNKVDAFTVVGAGDKALVTLQRSGEGWQVAQRANYPADVAKLREYLYKLADARVLDTKTASPKHYAELGVEDVSIEKCGPGRSFPDSRDQAGAQECDPAAKNVLVAIGGVNAVPKLIVGLYNGKGGGGTFVRREGEAQSLLASGTLLADKDPGAWIRKDVIDIDAARIKEVTLTSSEGKPLRIYKEQAGDANFKIADLPKGREPASDFAANGLASGLSNLRADDVAAARDVPAPEKIFHARYLTFDGRIVDVSAWETDAKARAQFTVSSDAAQLEADVAAAQARDKAAYETAVAAARLKVVEAKGDDAAIAKAQADVVRPAALVDPAKDRAERLAAANKSVEDLNDRLRGWTFTVPPYVFANFHKNMVELLKPIESGKKPAAGKQNAKPMAPLLLPTHS